MKALLTALALTAFATAPAYAKSCKDPKTGKFIKCAAAPAPAGGKCRDAKGHFAKCGTPGAKPAK